jgi:hypothetical protein
MREAWGSAANRRPDPFAQALRPIVGRGMPNRSDARRPTDRTDDGLVEDMTGIEYEALVESLDMFFLATADEPGHPNRSLVRVTSCRPETS